MCMAGGVESDAMIGCSPPDPFAACGKGLGSAAERISGQNVRTRAAPEFPAAVDASSATSVEMATMAKSKSKSLAKKAAKPAEAPLTTKVATGTPYQLDPAQVERAAKALVAHMKKHVADKEALAPVKNLADDEDDAEQNDQPIFLSITTKKHINHTNRLKPSKMSVYPTQMPRFVLTSIPAPWHTPSSPRMSGYASSPRILKEHTKISSPPTPSQLLSAPRCSAYSA